MRAWHVLASRLVIDLHSHVLPGIDDGPRDLAGSLAVARAARADGITTMAATPHLREDHPGVVPGELAERCAGLNDSLAEAGLDLHVVPAGEVDLLWAQTADSEELRLVSYCQRGSDLLVETPYGPLPPNFEELVFQLSLRGYRILLAHPERNATFQADPDRLFELVRRGILVQLTAMSLAGPPKSRSRALALSLVERGLAHVIASDAHALDLRPPMLAAGVAAAERVGGARARWMATDAPRAVLSGDPLPPPPAAPEPSRRRLLTRWRRRRDRA